MVDSPTAFYFGSVQYFPPKHLQHRMLTSLGWDVRRVRWDDWADLGPAESGKKGLFLRDLLEGSRPGGEELIERAAMPAATMQDKLRKLKSSLAEIRASERAARAEDERIDFDI